MSFKARSHNRSGLRSPVFASSTTLLAMYRQYHQAAHASIDRNRLYARAVGLLQSQSSEIALALRICAKADSNAHRYVSATDQARRFASASSAAPTSNPIITFATDASGPKAPPLQRVPTPAAGRT